jgi:hypothetical protein
MLRNVVVARFVASALPKAIKENTAHHALIAFHTSVLLEYISRAKALDDASLVFLLPAMLEPLLESAVRANILTKDVVVSALFHTLLTGDTDVCLALQLRATLCFITKMRPSEPCGQSDPRCDGILLVKSGTATVHQRYYICAQPARST